MGLNKKNILLIFFAVVYLSFLFTSCDDRPANTLWSIFLEIRNQSDSSTVDSAKILVSFKEDVILNFTLNECGYWGNGVYRFDGGSRENKRSVVERAIMNTEYHLLISKDGFFDLDTFLNGQTLEDTVVNEFDPIEKRAPAIYLKEKNGD